MKPFPGRGTTGYFLGLTRLTQAIIKRVNHRVKPCRHQTRHVISATQAAIAAMPNGGPMPNS